MMKERKNNPIKWPLLALLLLLPILSALSMFVSGDLLPFSPTGFLYMFLLSWGNHWLLPLLLSLLPLIGWVLLHFGVRQGKWIINGVLAALLTADVVIFFLHFITTMRAHNYELFIHTFYFVLACPIVCIPALILTNKWYPKI